MLVGDFQGLKIYRIPAADKRTKKDGTPREPKKIGRVHHPVFTPEGTRLVGFMVSLPDIAGMIKQGDRFVAYDAVRVYEGVLAVPDEKGSFDAAAAKRLGIELDRCLIWTGMDVRTVGGERVGYCADVAVGGKSGAVQSFVLTEGGASNALVGHREMPVSCLRGYRDGAMIVADEVLDLAFTGGAAARAAEASVKVKAEVKRGAKALDEHGSRAVDRGSRALGRQLGRTRGMFGSFMSEYKKASGSSEASGHRKQ